MPKTTPRDFFLQLGVIVGLYVSAVSLLTLLFHIINICFPDALEGRYFDVYYDPYSSGIRLAIAALVVIFTLYLGLARMLNRTYRQDATKRELPLRKWVSYLTLFAAGVTVAVDLIVLINSFLGGEITVRFILKIVAILIVAGVAFGYYLYDLKQTAPNARLNRGLAGLATVVVLAAVVGGFVLMGSPFTQRERRLDQQKVNDLQSLQWQIITYWQERQTLPPALTDLERGIDRGPVPHDPETDQPYEYRTTAAEKFELCANFYQPTPTPRGRPFAPVASISARVPVMEDWQHQAGRACFERTIDPLQYPPLKAGVPVKE